MTRSRIVRAIEVGAILALALAVRLVGIGQDANGDELYNLLAARNYLQEGTLEIHQGVPYERARLFTLLVAGLFRVFGESLAVGRIPAVVFGALAVGVVFLWLRSLGQRSAAWIAGLLMAVAPTGVILAPQVRFYTAQQLAFLLGCIGAYTAVEPGRAPGTRVRLAAASLLALWVAHHMHSITKIGVLGLGVYLLLVGAGPTVHWLRHHPRRVPIALVGLGLLIPGAVLALRLADVEHMAMMAGYADRWAQAHVHQWRFYLWVLESGYPLLWALLPLLAICALAARPRAALMSGTVFGVALTVHSVVAWKTERFIAYLLPFLFILAGLGLGWLIHLLAGAIPRAVGRWPALARYPAVPRHALGLVLAATVPFVVTGNPAFLRTADLLARDPSFTHPGMGPGTLSWSLAVERLRPLLDDASAIVSTEDTKALYYIGRLDFLLDWDHLKRWRDDPEFARASATGVPVVTEPGSLRAIMDCYPDGLLVAQAWSMRTEWKVPRDTAAFIAANMERVELPPSWGVEVYRWTSPATGSWLCPSGPGSLALPAVPLAD